MICMFKENYINGALLLDLIDEDLKEACGIKPYMHRKRLLQEILAGVGPKLRKPVCLVATKIPPNNSLTIS